jgi:hypothetical protein
MDEKELAFCELFKQRVKILQMLDLLRMNLTETGAKKYVRLKAWISVNLDKYLDLTNK